MPEIPSIGPRSIPTFERIERNGSAAIARHSAPETDSGPVSRDRIELSEHARLMERLRAGSGVRDDVVDRVRGEIADGSYDTPEKLDTAIDRLLEDLVG